MFDIHWIVVAKRPADGERYEPSRLTVQRVHGGRFLRFSKV
jgi:hypothetical protein